MKHDIQTVLRLSTAHVTQETCDLACSNAIPAALTAGYEEGFFCYVHDSLEDIPEDLVTCIEYARKLGCTWLGFDRDAPKYNDLPFYDW